jgi:hypothetical protein
MNADKIENGKFENGKIATGMRRAIYVLLLAMLTIGFVGCEEKGPAERAGESIDEVADDIKDSGKDLGNKIEDKCEDLKEDMGAEDEDC